MATEEIQTKNSQNEAIEQAKIEAARKLNQLAGVVFAEFQKVAIQSWHTIASGSHKYGEPQWIAVPDGIQITYSSMGTSNAVPVFLHQDVENDLISKAPSVKPFLHYTFSDDQNKNTFEGTHKITDLRVIEGIAAADDISKVDFSQFKEPQQYVQEQKPENAQEKLTNVSSNSVDEAEIKEREFLRKDKELQDTIQEKDKKLSSLNIPSKRFSKSPQQIQAIESLQGELTKLQKTRQELNDNYYDSDGAKLLQNIRNKEATEKSKENVKTVVYLEGQSDVPSNKVDDSPHKQTGKVESLKEIKPISFNQGEAFASEESENSDPSNALKLIPNFQANLSQANNDMKEALSLWDRIKNGFKAIAKFFTKTFGGVDFPVMRV